MTDFILRVSNVNEQISSERQQLHVYIRYGTTVEDIATAPLGRKVLYIALKLQRAGQQMADK